MYLLFSAWLDVVAALGAGLLVCFGYARFRRWIRCPVSAQMMLAASFGLAAAVLMQRPIVLSGLIPLDLGSIPVALAAAFFHGPNGLVTLAIAATARASLGGVSIVGIWAGLLGLVIAFCAGKVWSYWFRNPDRRGLPAFCALGLMMASQLLVAVILPFDQALRFLADATPPFLLLSMFTVPPLAAILEIQRRRQQIEHEPATPFATDADMGFLPLAALQGECAQRAAALGDGSFSQGLVIRIQEENALSILNTGSVRRRLLASMRLRLAVLLPQCDLAGMHGTSALVLPLTQDELLSLAETQAAVRRAVTEDPYVVAGTYGHRVCVDISVVALHPLEGFLNSLEAATGPSDAAQSRRLVKWFSRAQPPSNADTHRRDQAVDVYVDHLFAKAEFLMAQRASGHLRSG